MNSVYVGLEAGTGDVIGRSIDLARHELGYGSRYDGMQSLSLRLEFGDLACQFFGVIGSTML